MPTGKEMRWLVGRPIFVVLPGTSWLALLQVVAASLVEHWDELEMVVESDDEAAVAWILYALRHAVRLGAPSRKDQAVAEVDELLTDLFDRCHFHEDAIVRGGVQLFVNHFGRLTEMAARVRAVPAWRQWEPPPDGPPMGGC